MGDDEELDGWTTACEMLKAVAEYGTENSDELDPEDYALIEDMLDHLEERRAELFPDRALTHGGGSS